jgi:predicted nucleic acid-binding protein
VKAEIFSGVRSKDELQKLKRFFSALTDVPVPSDAWERIGELRSGLAARGIQASLVDLWIGLAASENGVLLWTLDKDFQHIARIVSLEMFEG